MGKSEVRKSDSQATLTEGSRKDQPICHECPFVSVLQPLGKLAHNLGF
jgi:hypothetical protein